MEQLPLFFNIKDRPCLVVGGGPVAERKIDLLLRAGARLTVIAPSLGGAVQARAQQGAFEHLAREFQDGDVAGRALVVAATNEKAVNERVSKAARAGNIPVNVVDTPQLCTFTFGSIVDRDPVTIAVSSAGRSPVLARALKARLESDIPASFGRLAALAGRYRDRVKAALSDGVARRRFWEWVMQGPVAELVFAGREKAAEEALQDNLRADADAARVQGEVYLVGAGPGDPDLLTFRALRILQKADVIFYDRLISQEILNFARRDAERFYVGKQRSRHCVPQSQINELLVENARRGRTVVRLKGGDPFIFGRGGEEATALAENGIEFQIVPGITSASGCSAYAGIPLTHRDYAQTVRFVTGHTRDSELRLDWRRLTDTKETLVVYMGLTNLQLICTKLIEHGLPADYPAAVIEQGTTPRQRVFSGTLDNLPDIVDTENVCSPGLVIIGRVVALREKLAWFEGSGLDRPAAGPRRSIS